MTKLDLSAHSLPSRNLGGALLSLALATVLLGACGPPNRPRLEPTRGYILISIDTLRADGLSAYGNPRPTSPFLDSLAQRGTLFENAVAQYPNTLASHMTLLTGLYPAQHGVYPPDRRLSGNLTTLPEVFQRGGFKTGGFTEGGFMKGRFGFRRGFDSFNDRAAGGSDDLETTLKRGLRFLRGVHEDERFFLFLHTYAVHAPYQPPPPYPTLYWSEAPPMTFVPTPQNLIRFNAGGEALADEASRYHRALYDAGVNYVDDELRGFFGELAALGMEDDVTVVVTSDHGEEFLEHGKMGHTQAYAETLRVPLIVVHPGSPVERRVPALVETTSLAPTLYELAGLSPPRDLPAASLVPFLVGSSSGSERLAYGENRGVDSNQRTLFRQRGKELYQLMLSELPKGTWINRRWTFDAPKSQFMMEVASFEGSRSLTVAVDGVSVRSLKIDPSWSLIPMAISTAARQSRVHLLSDSCSPSEDPRTGQWRCHSFRLRGITPRRLELFDLHQDPHGGVDLATTLIEVRNRLARRLSDYGQSPAAQAEEQPLNPEDRERLKALGYL